MRKTLNISVPLSVTMAIKSLTITEHAYNALKAVKCGDESFSDVIIRLSKEKVGAAAKFVGALKISDKEYDDWRSSTKKWKEQFDKDSYRRISKN